MITKTTKYCKGYETPQGLEESKYYKLMYEFVDLIKEKGLTVRQAQKLFTDCADIVMDTYVCNTVEYRKAETPSTLQPTQVIPTISIICNKESEWNAL